MIIWHFEKKNMLIEMFYNREIVLIWKFFEMNKIKFKIAFSQIIKIIKYDAWQLFEFFILKTLIEIMTEMLKNRLEKNILKFCHESYRNFWFLIKKKNEIKYRLINTTLKMNKMIIWNVNLFFFHKWILREFHRLHNCNVDWFLFLIMINWILILFIMTWLFLWLRSNYCVWLLYSWKLLIRSRNSLKWWTRFFKITYRKKSNHF